MSGGHGMPYAPLVLKIRMTFVVHPTAACGGRGLQGTKRGFSHRLGGWLLCMTASTTTLQARLAGRRGSLRNTLRDSVDVRAHSNGLVMSCPTVPRSCLDSEQYWLLGL